jgi:uncharacterized coiled-coil DUF342 family protein
MVSGFIAPENRARIALVMDRRNESIRQCERLRSQIDALNKVIKACDAEIEDASEYLY